MATVVSSVLDFMNNNPSHPISFAEVDHELQHLRKREHVSSLVAVAATVLAMITLGGIIGGGHVILGALCAIALVAAAYSYCCRLADTGLRNKSMITAPHVEANPVVDIFSKVTGALKGTSGK